MAYKNVGFSEGFDDYSTARVRLEVSAGEPTVTVHTAAAEVGQGLVTIEQQISRDITLTYVTNLTGALQQLVRLQWDFRRNWSVGVIRDENGVVGGDLQYKRRFK